MTLAHLSALGILADGAPTTPPGTGDMTTATVTPGLPGFVVFFVMAIALVLLALDLSRRVRRSSARENVRVRMEEAERAEREAAEPHEEA